MYGMGTRPLFRTILFALFLESSSGARVNGKAARNVNLHQTANDKDGSSQQQAVPHNHHGGGRGRRWTTRHCPQLVLTRPTADEESMLLKMMTVTRPNELGKGRDVSVRDPHRKKYSTLTLRSAWKVSDTPGLSAYHANVEKLNAEKNGADIPLQADAGAAKVGTNEYLLWHGGKAEYLEYKVCKSAPPAWGVFGNGTYLADAADKMDQYAEEDEDGKNYRELLNAVGLQDEKVSSGDLLFGLVMRTYMGHYAELQRSGYGEGGTWYWRDPQTGEKHQTKSDEIPFPSDGPRKAVAKSKDHLGGEKPNWFNEFLVPRQDLLAVEYIVVYDRV